MSYIVASKVKEVVNGKDMMAAGDLSEGLSSAVEAWLERGVKAAKANDRKTVRGCDILCFAAGKQQIVVASKIKEYVNGKDMMAAGDLPEMASALAEWLLAEAIKRAKENGRKTVRACDL
jgi:histone H3/H4